MERGSIKTIEEKKKRMYIAIEDYIQEVLAFYKHNKPSGKGE